MGTAMTDLEKLWKGHVTCEVRETMQRAQSALARVDGGSAQGAHEGCVADSGSAKMPEEGAS